jgi:hypothetical protein
VIPTGGKELIKTDLQIKLTAGCTSWKEVHPAVSCDTSNTYTLGTEE